MSGRRKPESPGPVVIRKGQVQPLPAGAGDRPAGERSEPAAAKPAFEKPLWQRLAEEKAAAARGAAAAAPQPRRPPGRPSPRDPGRRPDAARPRKAPPPPDASEGAPAPRRAAPRPPAPEPPPAPAAPVPDEGSFASMLVGEKTRRRRFQVGQKVAAKILQMGRDVAFLELGAGVAEGMIDLAELRGPDGNLTVGIGDIVDGVVVQAQERAVLVSRGLGRAHHPGREALAEAARTGLPVEGVVKAANKGGLEVEVMGQRAFCPMSQIDVRFVGDPASFVGQKLRFKVQKSGEREAVLSRRALLEEERAERARQTRARLAPGAVFEGAVTSVQDYGAFVDIGGIEGLVHLSELSWDRVSKPGDLLSPGDAVQVQVLEVREDPKKGERISLSVKALALRPQPAAPAAGAAPAERPRPPPPPRVGDLVLATVDKVEPYGVFVRFAGGRGLVPAAETGTPRGADLRRAFKVGDELTALVTAIDELGRIRLSKSEAEAAAERREAEEYLSRSQPRGEAKVFGTLGDLLRRKLEGK